MAPFWVDKWHTCIHISYYAVFHWLWLQMAIKCTSLLLDSIHYHDNFQLAAFWYLFCFMQDDSSVKVAACFYLAFQGVTPPSIPILDAAFFSPGRLHGGGHDKWLLCHATHTPLLLCSSAHKGCVYDSWEAWWLLSVVIYSSSCHQMRAWLR